MRYLLAFVLACLLSAETLDRLAVTVGPTVITDLQIDEDLRVAALLNSQPISRDVEARRAAADRLVEQLLIQHEIELSHYPPPSDHDVSTFYSGVEQTLGGADALKQLFVKYSVSEQTLRVHLLAQLATLRFIDVRFTPDISISDNDVETAFRRKAKGPVLDAGERVRLSQLLLAERTDAALNSWLAESRKQVNIVYIDSSLR